MSEPSRTYSSFDVILNAIRSAVDERSGSPLLIGVDGAAGSGKSTLAKNLADNIDDSALIHLDDFHDWDDDSNWTLSTFAERALEPLLAGLTSKHQRYDWPTDSLGEWFEIPAVGVAIVEGVTTLRPDLRKFWNVSVWVDCPRELRLKRGIERDGEDMRSKWVDDWMPGEDRYFENDRPWDSAGYIFDGAGMAEVTGAIFKPPIA
ncbi:uridine kinase family protein [Candidatus Lucifugimonas marina]|jgi:uridine kinase|uniref:Uridine kinase n=1 Tax=Candidatus Lucifugimonas marina TaxID=3038979 RepID=A0AAJ5ZH21_9CHLR|nr:uridine kinase [SAR202 cluster bacterium JH702]MDG0870534.1 uridine kinase [SAR202 cluster bacterium JH639]WFG35922.1 uridine kinase [SAR202 cluster bacterium JH545]WFG39866.1 uridine kinase [SAR202 cluster bacterium JH1073]